jgi:hypothetical protein
MVKAKLGEVTTLHHREHAFAEGTEFVQHHFYLLF